MRVSVLSYTPLPVQVAAIAGKVRGYCKIQEKVERIKTPEYWGGEEEQDKEYVQDLIDLGESSDIKHVTITFLIEGISQMVCHELVRHRVVSYSQLSMQYAPLGELQYIFPAEVYENEKLKELWDKLFRCAYGIYLESQEAGVSWELARYCLPMAVGTNIVMTIDLWSLRNFFKLWLDGYVTPEMKEVATTLFDIVHKIMPAFVEDLLYLVAEDK